MTLKSISANEIALSCLCLHTQRAARAIGRRYDRAFSAVDLTNGQFSLLMQLNRPGPVGMRELSRALRMDRTTLTAALKPLVRRGLIELSPVASDRRARLIKLTKSGSDVLLVGVAAWREVQTAIRAEMKDVDLDRLRADLASLARTGE